MHIRSSALRLGAIGALLLLLVPLPAAATPAVHSVATCAELQTLGADASTVADTINLTADLDCTGIANFAPMYSSTAFSGTFDGQGHSITHLTINQPGGNNTALFAATDSATISNLVLASGSVQGGFFAAGLIGAAIGTNIDHVTSHLDVDGTAYVAGLAGRYSDYVNGHTSTISHSSMTGHVTATSAVAGGLVAYMDNYQGNMTVTQSFSTGNVTTGGSYVGGLIARAIGQYGVITVTDSYASGNVDTANHARAGGLIGDLYTQGSGSESGTININRNYASGNVGGSTRVGGFIGEIEPMPGGLSYMNIADNFAVGTVAATTPAQAAAFVGRNGITDPRLNSSNNYFDQTRTGYSLCAATNAMAGCTAVNTSGTEPDFFKNNHINAPLNAWDFTTVWHLASGYPLLLPPEDNDGISAAIELAAPNNGDGNNDGITDELEPNVASFPNAVTGHYTTLALPSACAITATAVERESDNTAQDVGYDYPHGLLSFSADCGTPGLTVAVTQYYYGITGNDVTARKYDPRTHGYSTIPGATVSQTTIGGQTATAVSYQVTDGGPLDADGIADGTIVDPAGLGQNVVMVPNTGFGGSNRLPTLAPVHYN